MATFHFLFSVSNLKFLADKGPFWFLLSLRGWIFKVTEAGIHFWARNFSVFRLYADKCLTGNIRIDKNRVMIYIDCKQKQ